MNIHRIAFLYLILACLACRQESPSEQLAAQHTLSNEECDSPDGPAECSFINMPDNVNSEIVITYGKEPGSPLKISGKILRKDGIPGAGVLLYVYHTDNDGYYSKNGNEKGAQKWHGKLHGWGKTDSQGRYEIRTIRPAPYPNNQLPAHIHAVVKLPDSGKAYYIGDFLFDDDPIIKRGQPGNVVHKADEVMKMTKVNGVWIGNRDIILEN